MVDRASWKYMCEQTVNVRFERFCLPLYMYEKRVALDFWGILWYHIRVKLGCFATVPHGFDSVSSARDRENRYGRNRVTALAHFSPRYGRLTEFCLSCPICVSLFSAECPWDGRAYLCAARLRVCPTAGKADTGGRAGEVRSGTSASRYVDGSIIPALVVGFSRAGG